ncbi:L-threonine 3-dehydrogenase, partial [Francisella tularensis subsp. holarctica]|nr:L-threonine 3-dehydrogenase [Francisella tularensis subsp. holarctica]
RLQIDRYFGATFALNVSPFKNIDDLVKQMRKVMSDIGMTEGFDVGLEMSVINSAISMMLDVMNPGVKLSLLGISAGDISV